MEGTILTKKNCHRAATVRLVDEPSMIFSWGWREIKERTGFMHTDFTHVAKLLTNDPGLSFTNQVRDVEIELNKYEVVSWKYEENFEDLWQNAVRAFSNTSFTPEERAALYIRDYEACLQSDLKDIPEAERNEYTAKFREWVITLFAKHSSILSAMITGPARFPTARNEKANRSYDKAVEDFGAWRERYARGVARRIEAAKSPEQKANEEWEAVKREIDFNAQACGDIDNGEKGSYRTAFTNSIFGKVERLANNGKSEIVLKALEHIKQLQDNKTFGLKKPLFTSRHKIWQLKEVCEAAIQKQEERANKGNVEVEIEGGRIVKNFTDDRLQIFHDEKPSSEVITRLKQNGFKWSRFNGCWQRQLTQNSYFGAARVIYGNDVLSQERQDFITKLSKA